MGRRPPPAVLVAPEDMLSALRTSMLLGAVLPELRGEAQTLAEDLGELVRLRAAISADRDAMRTELASLVRGKAAARRPGRGAPEPRLRDRARGPVGARANAELGQRATSLKDLIERMERDSSGAASRRRGSEARRDARLRESRERFAAAAVRDPARLAPKTPSPRRGASCAAGRRRGDARLRGPDGTGGATRGVSIATRPRAWCRSRPTARWSSPGPSVRSADS
jgi:septal ring factor EnvC (AmiA/AmiB activator)